MSQYYYISVYSDVKLPQLYLRFRQDVPCNVFFVPILPFRYSYILASNHNIMACFHQICSIYYAHMFALTCSNHQYLQYWVKQTRTRPSIYRRRLLRAYESLAIAPRLFSLVLCCKVVNSQWNNIIWWIVEFTDQWSRYISINEQPGNKNIWIVVSPNPHVTEYRPLQTCISLHHCYCCHSLALMSPTYHGSIN